MKEWRDPSQAGQTKITSREQQCFWGLTKPLTSKELQPHSLVGQLRTIKLIYIFFFQKTFLWLEKIFWLMRQKLNFSKGVSHSFGLKVTVFFLMNTTLRVKHGRVSVIIWVCFVASWNRGLAVVNGAMDSAVYQKLHTLEFCSRTLIQNTTADLPLN